MSNLYFNGKLKLEQLKHLTPPADFSAHPEFTIQDARGTMHVFLKDETVSFAECIHFLPNVVRGNHYHKHTTELLFVAQGELRLLTADVESGEQLLLDIAEGDTVTIGGNIAHALISKTAATLICMFKTNPFLDRETYILQE